MSMARIANGEVAAARLPRTGTIDGRRVSNYHRLAADTLHAEGWREIVDERPDHDPDTQRVRRTGMTYDPDADVVRVDYRVTDRPLDPKQGDHLDPQIGSPDA